MYRFAFLGLVAISAAAAADVSNDVRCAEIALSQALESQDQAKFASLIDKDARFVGGPVRRGVDEIVEAWSGYFREGGDKIVWRPMVTEVIDSGDLALSRGPFRLTWVDEDGQENVVWGYFNSTWRLNDNGEWRVLFDAGGPSKSEPSDDIKALIDAPVEGCNISDKG